MDDNPLLAAIERTLSSLEDEGEIVVSSSTPNRPAKVILEAVVSFVLNAELSASEMSGLRSLVFHAVNDKRFFDWEMPTLTGLTADEFRSAAQKLPKG